MDHPRTSAIPPPPPPPFQSIRGCPSMSGHPWIIPGQVQYPPPLQSIRGCPSMSGHPWIICVTLLLSRCLQSSFYTKIKAYCCVDHKGIKCRREYSLIAFFAFSSMESDGSHVRGYQCALLNPGTLEATSVL